MTDRIAHWMLAVLLAMISSAFAATEHYDYDALGRLVRFVGQDGRVTEYVYDAVGNILEVKNITGTPGATLSIASVSPDTVRRRQSVPVLVAGTGLLGASVGSPDPTLRVSDLRSDTTEVRFTVTVDESAALGEHVFTLSSSLGSAGFTLAVRPAAPRLVAAPSPIVLAPDGDSAEILLTLGNVDDIDHRVDLAVTDPAVASVSVPAVVFPAGQTEARLTVTSGLLGNAVLDLTSFTLDPARVGLFVTDEGPGERLRVAWPVGVLRPVLGGPVAGPLLIAPDVGVTRDVPAPPLQRSGPFWAPGVGVLKGP